MSEEIPNRRTETRVFKSTRKPRDPLLPPCEGGRRRKPKSRRPYTLHPTPYTPFPHGGVPRVSLMFVPMSTLALLASWLRSTTSAATTLLGSRSFDFVP